MTDLATAALSPCSSVRTQQWSWTNVLGDCHVETVSVNTECGEKVASSPLGFASGLYHGLTLLWGTYSSHCTPSSYEVKHHFNCQRVTPVSVALVQQTQLSLTSTTSY